MKEDYKKKILSYQGEFNQESLKNLVDIIHTQIMKDTKLSKDPKIRGFIARDIYAVFIELAQNVQNYHQRLFKIRDDEKNESSIEIFEYLQFYTITSINKILNDEARTLLEYCQSLNKMNSQELEIKYKEIRKAPRKKAKKGAGLGLIEIIRKTGNPIIIKNKPIDKYYCYINMTAQIQKNNE